MLQRRLKLFFYTICAFGIGNEGGECLTSPFNKMLFVGQSQRHTPISKSLLDGWINDDPCSEYEMDIQSVVLSLATVTDDQSRREKLSRLFQVKLQNQDDGELFMKQFDSALITVGDRIRLDVANVAAAAMVNQSSRVTTDEETELPSFPLRSHSKSQLESQLWACVDMMVQSKMLMKQARMK
jgi:hypothetical protein